MPSWAAYDVQGVHDERDRTKKNTKCTRAKCKTAAAQRHDIDFTPDEDGTHELRIIFDGQELDAERFAKSLYCSYEEAITKRAAEMLESEYDKILDQILSIQETLENHDKLFEGKVWPYLRDETDKTEESKGQFEFDEAEKAHLKHLAQTLQRMR